MQLATDSRDRAIQVRERALELAIQWRADKLLEPSEVTKAAAKFEQFLLKGRPEDEPRARDTGPKIVRDDDGKPVGLVQGAG